MKHFLMCLLYIAALGVLSFVVGRLIPKHWFHADRFPWVCHPAEQKLWKRLHVRKWQAKIPDMSRIFVKIMPEKKLTKENYENLPRMIEETCVAEWTHILLSIAGLGLLKIWSGVGGVCITIIYIVLGNLPFMIFFIPLMALVSQLLHESIERRLHTRKPELSNVQSNSDENTDISQ